MSYNWERSYEKRPISTTLGFLALGVVVTFALTALGWGLMTGFSYWWGQGDAYRQKNSAQNWTAAQVTFHQQATDFDGYLKKIAAAQQAVKEFDAAHPNLAGEDGLVGLQDAQTRQGLATNLTGLRQQCVNVANAYNTASEGYLTADWKDADLPPRLDSSSCGS